MTNEELAITQVISQTVNQLSEVIARAERRKLSVYDNIARNYALCGVLFSNKLDSPLCQLFSSRLSERIEVHIRESHWLALSNYARIAIPDAVVDIENAWRNGDLERLLSTSLIRELSLHKSVMSL